MSFTVKWANFLNAIDLDGTYTEGPGDTLDYLLESVAPVQGDEYDELFDGALQTSQHYMRWFPGWSRVLQRGGSHWLSF